MAEAKEQEDDRYIGPYNFPTLRAPVVFNNVGLNIAHHPFFPRNIPVLAQATREEINNELVRVRDQEHRYMGIATRISNMPNITEAAKQRIETYIRNIGVALDNLEERLSDFLPPVLRGIPAEPPHGKKRKIGTGLRMKGRRIQIHGNYYKRI
jgi:hypothetical protein